MATTHGYTITGTKEVARNVRKMATKYPQFAADALNDEAEFTLKEAIKLTPVESGDLWRSAGIAQIATMVKLETIIMYGKEYALAVHEIPAPPMKSTGGRSARHDPHIGSDGKMVGTGGQWKFLSTAINQRAQKFMGRIAGKIGVKVKRMKLATGK
jgi:hypothetical protein